MPVGAEDLAGLPSWVSDFQMGELLVWKGVTFKVVALGSPGILLEAIARRVTVAKERRKP